MDSAEEIDLRRRLNSVTSELPGTCVEITGQERDALGAVLARWLSDQPRPQSETPLESVTSPA